VILLSSEAVSDLERVRSFLDQLNPGAAKRALKRIWDALEMVERLPSLGPPPNIRKSGRLLPIRLIGLHRSVQTPSRAGHTASHAHLAQSRGAEIAMDGPAAGAVLGQPLKRRRVGRPFGGHNWLLATAGDELVTRLIPF
jgi:hypothetical protein